MSSSYLRVFSTGLAMFSMFFGAGNVIFPLVIGQLAGNQTPFAVAGLLLTAVGVPFLGLIAIFLFEGNYRQFFGQLGKVPGFMLAASIMCLIGPFGGLPRCVALSFASMQTIFPDLSFQMFSLTACGVLFLCSFRPNQLVKVIGLYLTPLLLTSLFIIIIRGLWTGQSLAENSLIPFDAFNMGLLEGYNTMDLLASFFFSTIIYSQIKKEFQANTSELLSFSLKACLIGGFLLSIIYIGFSLTAALHAESLEGISKANVLAVLTLKILGPAAGILATMTIASACLTTAIALTTAFAEFLQNSLTLNYLNYRQSLVLTLIASYLVSLLEFNGIVKLLEPLLQVIYPALIVFSIVSIGFQLYKMNKSKQIYLKI